MIRKTVFWMHLCCGVTAGLVILMMSVTGVILTYERQLLAWADRRAAADEMTDRAAPAGAARPSIEAMLARARAEAPEFTPTAVTVSSDRDALVTLAADRGGGVRYVDPDSGAMLGDGATTLRAFFATVTGWHRWFNASGESRGTWRSVTGASNLLFLFLILSGLYLWLPRVWKAAMLRARLWFVARPASAHARDFNWHHVLGVWSALPLAIVVASAVVFSYPWANGLLYRAFGEETPVRGRGGPPAAAAASRLEPGTSIGAPRPLEALLERAAAHVPGWREISLQLPAPNDTAVRFTIDAGNGGQPHRRHTLVLDAYTGDVVAWNPFQSQSPARRARTWVRFLHTGEALGVAGQTVAGLVSLTSAVMVWTGLALAYRRLVVPLLKRRARAAR